MFDVEFGDCDESLHPHCEGVECETVLLVSGFESLAQAEDYARDVMYDRVTVAAVLAGPGEGLTASTMMTEGRDPAGVIIRDYNVADTSQPCGEQGYSFVAGGHDEFSLYLPD
ncbi:MAG: hypothetical protein ACRCYU_13135 [Nocardioides sp.]